ncbi:MAG: hypothetical protein PVJ57_01420 [Phycisphaerae bacterium]|jgi:hypothetical protein
MDDTAPETSGQRPPLLITRVPPPAPQSLIGQLATLLVVVVVVSAVPVLVLTLVMGPQWLIALAVVNGLVVFAIVTWAWTRARARVEAQRAAHAAQFPDWAADPLAQKLASQWRPRKIPDIKTVRAALDEVPPLEPPRPRIICLGAVEIPEVGDHRFEPVIITPTRFVGRRLWLVVAAVMIVAVWLAEVIHILPRYPGVNLGSFSYFLFAGGVVAATWVWRTMIRPTYVRLAPGVVQIVRFPFGKGKPNIRSYPMDAEAVVLVVQAPVARVPAVMTLARGDRHDNLPVWQMSGRAGLMEQLWQALLSTAPTPPLSEEELLG